MVEIKGKQFCENCFKEISSSPCPHCGFDPAVTVSDPTMLRPGSILLGKYIVGKVIGKGGFGVTYLAYDVSTNRKVAIKEFFPYGVALRAAGTTTVSVASMDNAEAFKLGAEKFYNEAKLVSRFNGNPNIVGVHEFFYENDTVYFAMEYLEGHTLKDHIAEHGVISAPQALFIMQNVANALMAAHSSNVLHRDISPDNIILCDNGDVKLIDFGAARQVVAEHSQSFSVILKPGFAPLEQYQKKGNQGPWTDIYSLGTTIYYSLTADIPEDPMSRIDDDKAFSSNQYNINEELWAVISKAAGLRIEDRYGDVFALKNDLSRISFAPEPVIIPNAAEEQMPEFRTAVPYGMTRSDPNKQPVAAGGVYANTLQQAGYPVQQGGAPAQPQSKPGFGEFIAKHKRAVFAAAGALVIVIAAVIIIPNAIKSANAAKDPDISGGSNGSYSSDSGAVVTPGSDPLPFLPDMPSTDIPPVSSNPPVSSTFPESSVPPSSSNFELNQCSSTYYTTLYDKYKPLYEAIYNGISGFKEQFEVSADYTAEEISIVYYMVAYDNPLYYYVSDFKLNGSYVVPNYYLGRGSELQESFDTLSDSIENLFNYEVSDNKMKNLCSIHDILVSKVLAVPRYSTATCTSIYGALSDLKADDLGLSKAFCYMAQYGLELPCVVVDGTVNGEVRSWCRVKVDGTWYNVDIYGDMTAGDEIKTVSLDTSTGSIFHTYFLTNDTFINYCKYVPNTEYNFLLTGNLAANSEQANYYIEDGINGNNYTFYYDDADAAYNEILDWAAERYKDGYYDSSISIASFIADEVWAKVKSNMLTDLYTKYSIDVSGNGKYCPDDGRFEIVLKAGS